MNQIAQSIKNIFRRTRSRDELAVVSEGARTIHGSELRRKERRMLARRKKSILRGLIEQARREARAASMYGRTRVRTSAGIRLIGRVAIGELVTFTTRRGRVNRFRVLKHGFLKAA